jgi:epsilon-lactone hydrolase
MSQVKVSVDAHGNVQFGARIIALPSSISAEAREGLIAAYARPAADYPPITDKAAWKTKIAQFNASFEPIADMMLQMAPATVATTLIDGVTVHVGTPHDLKATHRQRAVLELHGGGLVLLGGKFAQAMAATVAAQCGCVVYSVDYRMPPDHPYPAAIDDTVAVYRHLLAGYRPGNIAIAGGSAGGNLAAAATLKIRDLGLPLPAAVVLKTPEVDLTESGDSFTTNFWLDAVLKCGLPAANALYADGHDLADPYISPLFGDFSQGFPPTFLQAGTRDVFLSNAVRMHRALRRAGVEAELHVWEGMPHGGFGMAPEDEEIPLEINCFLEKHWGRA